MIDRIGKGRAVALAPAALWALAFCVNCCVAEEMQNQLSRAETVSGWQLLFDGKTTEHFRNYKRDSLSDGWTVEEGALSRSSNGAGDIITKETFRFFELSIEYRISSGGNSGIMFHVEEGDGPPWHTGPEVQVLCNEKGKDPQRAGWLYQIFQPRKEGNAYVDATRPAGQWNHLYLRVSPLGCEVCMNGVRYYTFALGGEAWDRKVAKSKFAQLKKFGKVGSGHICLQDHGDPVAYRNIKIRKLNEDGSLPKAPVDGKLNVVGKVAFPELEWEDYQPVDDDGNLNKQLRVVELTTADGLSKRLFAAAQQGMVYTFENRPDVKNAQIVLDLRDKVSRWWSSGMANEQGLLGLAMHPQFSENRYFYVYYTALNDDRVVVSRFQTFANEPLKADPESEFVLLEIAQPFKNHNGGSIEFGPDGFLYIGVGDGGYRDDPQGNGENLETLLGSILRIDVNAAGENERYSIPRDNPFVDTQGARPEIFAFGLRNPWRIAFDRKSGQLWCGDVGQELWEEVNIIQKGHNYGWSSREGTKPFSNRPSKTTLPTTDPIWEYDHGVGKSITGGRVYRSSRLPELNGKYLYADYVSGGLWALSIDESNGSAVRNDEISAGGIPVLAFGQDESGEVFYMTDNGHNQCIFRFESR